MSALSQSLMVLAGLLAIALPLSAQPLNLSRNFRPDPLRFDGSSSGSVSLAELSGGARGCRGFSSPQPSYTLNLGDNFPLLDVLAFTNDVESDATMLLMGDNGMVVCADNENRGRNPQISMRLPKGSYRLWIGSRDANKPLRYTLSLSEIKQR
jgi:hypothetical protein